MRRGWVFGLRVEQLLVKGLTAATFDPSAADGELPEQARTVVVGGGIVGASVAYHLAALGRIGLDCVTRNEPGYT